MASAAGAIRAGRAFVEVFLDKSKLQKGMKALPSDLKLAGTAIAGIGAGIAGVGTALTAGLLSTIPAASAAQETQAKFNAVFGENAKSADGFAQTLSDSLGRNLTDVRNGMSAFQAMFVGLNFDAGSATKMSQAMQEMALDFAAFFDISDPEALDRFRAAMSGSAEVLDQFGVNIRQAAIEQKLMEMGINKSAQQASEQEKTLARLAIIYESMGRQGAVGAAARESGNWAGQMRVLTASFQTAKEAIGAGVIDAVLPFLRLANQVITPIVQWIEANKQLAGVALVAGLGLMALGGVLMFIGGTIAAAGFALSGLTTIVAFFAGPVGIAVAAFAAWLVQAAIGVGIVTGLATAFFTMTEAGRTMWAAISGFLMNMWGIFSQVFGGIFAALSSGNLGLAATIGWLGIKLAFIEGGIAIVDSFAWAFDNVSNVFAQGLNWLSQMWTDFITWISGGVGKLGALFAAGLARDFAKMQEIAGALANGDTITFSSDFIESLKDPKGTLTTLRDETKKALEDAIQQAKPNVAAAAAGGSLADGLGAIVNAAMPGGPSIADLRGTFNGIAAARAFGAAPGQTDKAAQDETLQETNGLLEQILAKPAPVLGVA